MIYFISMNTLRRWNIDHWYDFKTFLQSFTYLWIITAFNEYYWNWFISIHLHSMNLCSFHLKCYWPISPVKHFYWCVCVLCVHMQHMTFWKNCVNKFHAATAFQRGKSAFQVLPCNWLCFCVHIMCVRRWTKREEKKSHFFAKHNHKCRQSRI